MNLPAPLLLMAISSVALLTAGCSTAAALTNKAPSISARFVQKWAFADFARDVEGRSADVRVSSAFLRPTENPVLLVPVPATGSDAFSEMKQLSQTGDEVSEFVDAADGRYFFCLTRAGHIVKTYEFENRAQPRGQSEGSAATTAAQAPGRLDFLVVS